REPLRRAQPIESDSDSFEQEMASQWSGSGSLSTRKVQSPSLVREGFAPGIGNGKYPQNTVMWKRGGRGCRLQLPAQAQRRAIGPRGRGGSPEFDRTQQHGGEQLRHAGAIHLPVTNIAHNSILLGARRRPR